MKQKKLTLNKQKVTKLTNSQSASIKGGLGMSTRHKFTCGWCTGSGGPQDPGDPGPRREGRAGEGAVRTLLRPHVPRHDRSGRRAEADRGP